MKKSIYFLVMGIGVGFFSATTNHDSFLTDVIRSKTVVASFTGTENSTHYLKPLTASFANVTTKKVSFVVPPGYHFKSDDSTVQDIIITQEQWIVLNPKESVDIQLSGMCIQNHHSAPDVNDSFSLSGWAKPKLKQTAEVIARLNRQDYQGQRAMWVVSDGNELTGIIGMNTNNERLLLDEIAVITGQPKVSEEDYKKASRKVSPVEYKAELRGYFAFSFSRPVPIHIALFTEDGIVLQEIYQQKAKPGRHKVEYVFDAMPYQGQTIHAKLIAFDDVLMDRTIAL